MAIATIHALKNGAPILETAGCQRERGAVAGVNRHLLPLSVAGSGWQPMLALSLPFRFLATLLLLAP